MKKVYYAPKLTVHGNLSEITQAQGNQNASDFIIVGGTSFPTNGSRDFNVPQ
jgi:hypothetical protein